MMTASESDRRRPLRDLQAEIRQRNQATRIATLRQLYGRDFAAGYAGSARLSEVLDDFGVTSLVEYLKRR